MFLVVSTEGLLPSKQPLLNPHVLLDQKADPLVLPVVRTELALVMTNQVA